MRQSLLIGLSVFLLTTVVNAQKATTVMGEAWTGVVESSDDATREVKIVNPNNKTETFVGVLQDGYQVKLKDATSRELKVSELKPGLRLRVFYKSKTQDVAGQRKKVNLINRIQFLGRDDYTRLREMLKLQPAIPVTVADATNLPAKDSLKLYLALEPQDLLKSMAKWVDQWNKEQSAKYGRVEIVDDPAQADASLVVIWGSDDSFITPSMVAYHRGDPHNLGFATVYLTTKTDAGLNILWQERTVVESDPPEVRPPGFGKSLEKKLKARSK